MVPLSEIAEEALVERGFIPQFPKQVLTEVDAVKKAPLPPSLKDLRHFLWVSIDNDDSRDLDQITYAEKGKIYVAVADVDAIVKKGSPTDRYAAHNTTSIYTPTQVFPMLPARLSYDLTSLNENRDRSAIVVEMTVDDNGKFELSAIYPAWVKNGSKLSYRHVGAFLEKGIDSGLPATPGLKEQLTLQNTLAERIQNFRNSQGALYFAEHEVEPVIEGGVPTRLEKKSRNRAHHLIENFMIAANVGATCFLEDHNKPTLRRIVRAPKRWDRIVALAKNLGETLPPKPDVKALRAFLLKEQTRSSEQFPDLSLSIIKLIGRGEYVLGLPGEGHLGHFDLAEVHYAHTTAPNRRYPDLIMQRLLKSTLYNESLPYTQDELISLATHCTIKEDDATKVERRLIKCAAAVVLSKEIGKQFKAIVTGSTDKGTWVRISHPPVEGKLLNGSHNFDVGDHITVRLIHVDTFNGHIDFQPIDRFVTAARRL